MGADLELAVGGRPLRFPAVWLRDNGPCPECLAPGTGQNLKDITDIPNGLAVTQAVLKRKEAPAFAYFEALLRSQAYGKAR